MAKEPPFTVFYAPEALDHLGVIERKYHGLIRRTIAEQLTYEPEKLTRNRKPLEQPAPFGATWQLRFGPANRFRVFYEVDADQSAVWVLAVGVKEGKRWWFGGEEYQP